MGVHSLVNRVKDLEYNMAVTDLDRDAETSASATDLKGILTDSFIGTSKMDISHPDFSCCIDSAGGYLSTYRNSSFEELVYEDTSTSRKSVNNVITAPYTEELYISQPVATSYMLVNPYQVYNKLVELKLSPSIDKWTETVRYSTESTTSNIIYSEIGLATLQAFGATPHEYTDAWKYQVLSDEDSARSYKTIYTG